MNLEERKPAWQTQSTPTSLRLDPDLLLQEVRRNQQYLTAMFFWRDVREIGTALLLAPLWCYLGLKLGLHWTWYFVVPALLWAAGYLLADRLRQARRRPLRGEPLRRYVEESLTQVEHQIWLLGNVFWWYLLPVALSVLPFVSQVAWHVHGDGGWLAVLVVACLGAIAACILAGVYRANQNAVRGELVPRRQELEALLRSLQEELPAS